MEEFDYIIVGAGSAGCVIANRLSADPGLRVALIEAGPTDGGFPTGITSRLPVGNIFLLPSDRFNWRHEFQGGPGVNGRSIPCPRGRMLGGSSSINGTVYMRGHRGDYDDWADAGNPGWSWLDVLRAYKKQENWQGGESQFHGHGGELDVQAPRSLNPLSQAFIDAAVSAGHPRNGDFNGAAQEGFGAWELNQRNGVRASSARAFLEPVRGRRNLTVLTDTHVGRIVVEGRRAVAVAVVRNGLAHRIAVRSEIILSGGTINSPQTLLVSGVGPAAQLQGFGIDVVHDLPGVGENLQDHPSAYFAVDDRSRRSYALNARTLPRVALSPFRYLLGRTGMLTSNAAEAGGFLCTRPGLSRPDIQVTFMPGLKVSARSIPREHGVMAFVTLLRPNSRGTVTLASPDPKARPVLRPNFLEHPDDLRTLLAGMRETRRILSQSPIKPYLGDEIVPGADQQTDEQLEAVIRATLATLHHPVGTCKMGPRADPTAVVDHRLRVHGLTGLRVADASVMPTIVGGNTSAPAMMIGERVSGFILEDRARTP